MYSKHGKGVSSSHGPDGDPSVIASEKLTLVDHFTGFLLSVFVDGGLVDVSQRLSVPSVVHEMILIFLLYIQALIDVVEEGHQLLSRKATLLVGEILALASKLLPSEKAADIQVCLT